MGGQDAGGAEVKDEPPRQRRLAYLLVPIACLVVASNLGSALAPSLVNDHPLTLIALDARNRHLALVAGRVDAIPYFVVGAMRLLLSDPLFYLLGLWYGETALAWMDRRTGSLGRTIRSVERFFSVAAYPFVFIAPNNYVCLFAGASRMAPAVFLTLNVTGTVARLALFRVVGNVFADPIDSIIDFIGRYRVPLTVAAFVTLAIQIFGDRRKGEGELQALGELKQDVERAGEGPDDPQER